MAKSINLFIKTVWTQEVYPWNGHNACFWLSLVVKNNNKVKTFPGEAMSRFLHQIPSYLVFPS